jgi:methylmalonyl-CoA mutase N-terminal domain/subunit
VGVNDYIQEQSGSVERLQMDPTIEAQARARLAALRAGRDGGQVSERLAHLEAAARGSDNLMPLFVAAVESSVTVGEICRTLRDVWGEYRPAV